MDNTYPLLYRGWVFAHNGTINREALLKLLRRKYWDFEGDTDSEAFLSAFAVMGIPYTR